MSVTIYSECAYEGCTSKTSKQFCRHHSVKYNVCAYKECGKRCRGVFCGIHRPELMEKRRDYARQLRAMKKQKKIEDAQADEAASG